MNVLVTGAAGFIGRHVAARLDIRGHDVVRMDRRIDGLDFAAVNWWSGGGRINIPNVRPDVICHIGGIGDVYEAKRSPAEAYRVNGVGGAQVAQAAAYYEARVIYASTWEVTEPREPYAGSKAAGEHAILGAQRMGEIQATSLRLGSCYGPGMRPNGVMRVFYERARDGEDIELQGGGKQWRQWTHVDDVAEAFVKAVEHDGLGAGEILNVVGKERVSIAGLAEQAIDFCNRGKTVVTAARPADVPPVPIDCTDTLEVLGWEPIRETLRGYVELMVFWAREERVSVPEGGRHV